MLPCSFMLCRAKPWCVVQYCVMLCLSSHSLPFSFFPFHFNLFPIISFPPISSHPFLFFFFFPFFFPYPFLPFLSFLFNATLLTSLSPLNAMFNYPIIKFLPPGLTFVKVVPLQIQPLFQRQTRSLFQRVKTKSTVIKQYPSIVLKHL